MKVFGDIQSGNCYKIKLLLSFLNLEYEWIHIDTLEGGTSTLAFQKMNPNGKIPLLETSDGRYLSESNAILNYLAEGSEYLPQDHFDKAKVLQWQFFEQYSHEPYIAVARYIKKYLGLPEGRQEEYKAKQMGGHKALSIMNEQLAKTSYLVGEQLTIADISLYGYTHVSHEGGFDLDNYPNIEGWIQRIQLHPRYIGME